MQRIDHRRRGMGPARGRDAEWRERWSRRANRIEQGDSPVFPFPFGRGPLTVFSFLRQKPTTCRNFPVVCDPQNNSWADWSFGSLNQSRLGSTARGRVWQSYSRFLRKENWSRNSSRSQLHRESRNSKRRNLPQALSRQAYTLLMGRFSRAAIS